MSVVGAVSVLAVLVLGVVLGVVAFIVWVDHF